MKNLRNAMNKFNYDKRIQTGCNLNLSRTMVKKTIKEVLKGDVLEGEKTEEFESKFKDFLGMKYAISTSSGRMALYLILKSLNLKKGDEIIIPAYMLPLLPQISTYFGLKPVFADIDPNTFNIDPKEIEKKITDKTKVILAVHIFGQPCDIERIAKIAEKNNIILVEDAAQALGAEYNGKKVGSFGKINLFSFQTSKNLTTFDGGMIVTNDEQLYKKIMNDVKKMRWPKKSFIKKSFIKNIFLWNLGRPIIFSLITYPILRLIYLFNKDYVLNYYKSKGVKHLKKVDEQEFLDEYGFRYTNIQASLGLKQLEGLNYRIESSNKNAEFLNSKIKNHPFIITNCKSIYFRYVIKTKNPKILADKLFKAGILTADGSYLVLPDLDMFKEFKCECPNARDVAQKMLYLPVHPQLNQKDLMKIVDVIERLESKIHDACFMGDLHDHLMVKRRKYMFFSSRGERL